MTTVRRLAVLTSLVFLTLGWISLSQAQTQCPRPNESCPQGVNGCWAKFKIEDIKNEKTTLVVRYPESVFKTTTESDKEVDRHYIEQNNLKGSFTIHIKQGALKPEKGKTYLFLRCPDPRFEIQEDIEESDEN
jgi:hypothetical protein